eukprot:TRINITY_DN1542_c0_g3_i1.p2 TRINITY_DN1542_c0_g3~~TRINITY_DN1542_c0_g3_i1.p2  ORF type:complete len:417 (-),score=103.40 TRINITY_DN1542_c0_g3_i1:317-1567(-)
MSTKYAHSSAPRAVPTATHAAQGGGPKSLFREPKQGSMMADRRIVRGNTYSAHVLSTEGSQNANSQGSQGSQIRRNNRTKKRGAATATAAATARYGGVRMGTPEPVDGRAHMDVQTEHFLEEITDRVVEADVVTQTDAFMDRPPTPVFVPKKTGVDSETQVYDGDLFDFDLEVSPLLEILVGKTLEQGLMEVCEEEELANMRAHQEEFIELRNAELAETQRLEEAERRRFEEKERRLRQERERQERERERKEIAAAREFARTYLHNLEPAVFNNLSETGYFHDPVLKEVENEFVPWLEARLVAHVDRAHVAHGLADLALTQAFAARTAARAAAMQAAVGAEAAERDARVAAEEERVAQVARERREMREMLERGRREEQRAREDRERRRRAALEEEEESEDGEEERRRRRKKDKKRR